MVEINQKQCFWNIFYHFICKHTFSYIKYGLLEGEKNVYVKAKN